MSEDFPLRGLLVLSLEQAVAAPLASARLADLGARVIKVERAEGDFARGYDKTVHGESAFFIWLNRGKESLVCDIKNADDAALLQRIAARADVFIQNLAPGGAGRAGLGSDALREQHPRLITCDITGYGETGPYSDMKAYDLLVQAESGLASVTGSPQEPGRVGISACDIGTGMNAFSGILQALYTRERTGRGSGIRVSMFDSMAEWMTAPLLMYEHSGQIMQRTGMSHPLVAPYGPYGVQGGGQLMLAIQNDREWARFAAGVLERPELGQEPRFATNLARVEHRAAMDAEINAVFQSVPRASLEERLRTHQIAYGALNTVAELSKHPQMRRRDVRSGATALTLPASPIRHGAASSPGEAEIPAVGSHSQSIREEFAG